MFVIRSEHGYVAKSNRSLTTDLNKARVFNTERSARHNRSSAMYGLKDVQVIPVKVTIELI
jgi:hypothetical protein